MKESPIFSRTYDLLRWLVPLTIKFPRQHRFVLAAALQRSAFALQECLLEAALGTDVRRSLVEADVCLAKVRLYLRLGHDLGLVSTGQQAHAASMVDEIGRLLGGWRRAQASPRGATR